MKSKYRLCYMHAEKHYFRIGELIEIVTLKRCEEHKREKTVE